jgi:hypothetical protein
MKIPGTGVTSERKIWERDPFLQPQTSIINYCLAGMYTQLVHHSFTFASAWPPYSCKLKFSKYDCRLVCTCMCFCVSVQAHAGGRELVICVCRDERGKETGGMRGGCRASFWLPKSNWYSFWLPKSNWYLILIQGSEPWFNDINNLISGRRWHRFTSTIQKAWEICYLIKCFLAVATAAVILHGNF